MNLIYHQLRESAKVSKRIFKIDIFKFIQGSRDLFQIINWIFRMFKINLKIEILNLDSILSYLNKKKFILKFKKNKKVKIQMISKYSRTLI